MTQRFSIVPAKAVGDNDLTDEVFRTLAALGIYGDKHGWCWPSNKTIGNVLGKSPRTVRRHIAALARAGYVNVSPRFDKKQQSNKIQIKFDFPEELPPPDTADVRDDTADGLPPMTQLMAYPPDTADVHLNALVNAPINAPIKTHAPSPFLTPIEAESIYCSVTGNITFGSGNRDNDIERIAKIFLVKGFDTTDYLRPFWYAWRQRRYSKSNSAWLDWAVAGEIPKAKSATQRPPIKRMLEEAE